MVPSPDGSPPHHHVAIIGTGFGGLGAAIRLRRAGEDDLVLFERAADVGGVWRDNQYPGCACDVQSHLYCFDFAPNPSWSRRFAPQPEIWEYLRDTARRFGVLDRIRFGHDVEELHWDDTESRWWIRTSKGFYTADVVISAAGALAEPKLPNLPGLDRFRGHVLHTAKWDPAVPLRGLRVAVVGTGASAIQVIPAIQPLVEHLVVFQRTPPWVVPRLDRPLEGLLARVYRAPILGALSRAALREFRELVGIPLRRPGALRFLERAAVAHLHRQIRDPELRRRLTPEYRIGCKRILLSDDYYPSLTRPNVELVSEAAREVTRDGVVSASGGESKVDLIVFATGFHVTDFPFARRIRGRDGRLLSDEFGASPRAHLGTTVHGFPNLFILQGPNTGLGHNSVVLMMEAQIDHALNALAYMRRRGVRMIEPTAEAQAAFVREVDRRMEGTVWTSGGCRSWYLDETGRNSTLWPGSVRAFRRRVSPFHPGEYHRGTAARPRRSADPILSPGD
jgi:cation diffusion facilitator CzcD-associated flavoprotein CzcO